MPNAFAIEAVTAAYNESEDWLEELLDYLADNAVFVRGFCREYLSRVRFFKARGDVFDVARLQGLRSEGFRLADLFSSGEDRYGRRRLVRPLWRGFMRLNIARRWRS